MNLTPLRDNWALLLWSDGSVTTGLLLTVELLIASLALGLALALPLAVMRASPNRWLSAPVWLLTYVVRGTPLLLQIYALYYGLAEVRVLRESAAWPLLRHAFICAWLAFSLNTAAYTTEIFAGALLTTARGEVEAAVAFGLNRWTRLSRILGPGALRRALPAYSNEVMFTLHGTALASSVTLLDLGGVGRALSMRYASPYAPYVAALVLYALCSVLLMQGFRIAERRWLGGLPLRVEAARAKVRLGRRSRGSAVVESDAR